MVSFFIYSARPPHTQEVGISLHPYSGLGQGGQDADGGAAGGQLQDGSAFHGVLEW